MNYEYSRRIRLRCRNCFRLRCPWMSPCPNYAIPAGIATEGEVSSENSVSTMIRLSSGRSGIRLIGYLPETDQVIAAVAQGC
jgi:hypothetical protein